MDTLRLAVVTETFYPFRGGSAKRYQEVLKRLVRKGYEIDLYTVKLDKAWSTYEEIDGIKIYRTNSVLKDFITSDGFRSINKVLLFSLWAFKRILKNGGQYQIIEANHCPIFPVMGSWIESKLLKISLSVTFHEAWHSKWYWYVPNKLYAPLGIMSEKIYVKMPDVGIAVSEITATRLSTLLGMKKERIVVIPNGVDLSLFSNSNNKRVDHKIIYVGRLNRHKKVEWLIDAVYQLKKDYRDIYLEIVGDGPIRETYKAYVKKKGMETYVKFFGPLDDAELAERLKQAYVYVLPSIREGQSITTLEAMAAGTPQIVLDLDDNGAAELIRKSGSGLIAKPSPSNIAEKISQLLNDKQLWLTLQYNGYNFIKNYDWNVIADQHDKVYKKLVSNDYEA